MSVPAELKYTQEHEWAKIVDDTVTVGITDYAQGELGDIVYIELPEVGAVIEKGDAFGNIEAVKAVSDLYSPVAGEVVAVNDDLGDKPETINSDPYGDGWMVKIKISNSADLDELLSAEDYEEII
jgi:glycine cleavage system H protein